MDRTAVIEALNDQALDKVNATIFYYCESRPGLPVSSVDICSSWIKQLFLFLITTSQDYPTDVDNQLHNLYDTSGILPDLDDAVELLAKLFQSVPNAFCIVDGLDELEDKDLERMQKALRELFQASPNHEVKLFVTSRTDFGTIHDKFSAIHVAITSSDLLEDIRHYVDTSIKDKNAYVRQRTTNEALLETLKERLVAGSEGM